MTKLIAYHGKEETKQFYVNRVKAHYAADEIIKGKYWENGKGCAVGCSIHSSNHSAYETELGVPEWLARVEDSFFENLPDDSAKEWPVQFLEAINPGATLENIKAPFMIYILEQSLGNFDHTKYPDVKKSIDTVIDLWKMNPTQSDELAWSAAYSGAWSAAAAVQSAAVVKYSEKLLELMRECKKGGGK